MKTNSHINSQGKASSLRFNQIKKAILWLAGIIGAIKDSLAHGENVYLRGFGSFIVKIRAEKTARNISKNTTIIIPAHNIPAFKPANSFKEEVAK